MGSRSGRKFSRSIQAGQRLPYVIGLRVTGTGTAVIDEGGNEATLVDNGTGDYTLTFSKAFSRVPAVVGTPLTADTFIKIHAVSASAVQIKTFSVSAQAAQDAVFHLVVYGWDAADVV